MCVFKALIMPVLHLFSYYFQTYADTEAVLLTIMAIIILKGKILTKQFCQTTMKASVYVRESSAFITPSV